MSSRQGGENIQLPVDNPTAHIYVDESGTAGNTQLFVVGALKLRHQGNLVNEVVLYRDRSKWFDEARFSEIRQGNEHHYRALIDILARSDARMSACVVDRRAADPFTKWKHTWQAHGRLMVHVLRDLPNPGELVCVTLDYVSTMADIDFEGYVKVGVNKSLDRLAVVTATRMNSKACFGLQLADLFTGAVAQRRRQASSESKPDSAKGRVAAYFAKTFNLEDLGDCSTRRVTVGQWSDGRRRGRGTVSELPVRGQRRAG